MTATDDCNDILTGLGKYTLPLAFLLNVVGGMTMMIETMTSTNPLCPMSQSMTLTGICAGLAFFWPGLFTIMFIAPQVRNFQRILVSPLKFVLYGIQGLAGLLTLIQLIVVSSSQDVCIIEYKRTSGYNSLLGGGILVILSTILTVVYIRMYAWVSTTYTLLEDVKSFCVYFGPVTIVSLKLVGGMLIWLVVAADNSYETSNVAVYTAETNISTLDLRWDVIIERFTGDTTLQIHPIPGCLEDGLAASRIVGIVGSSLALPVAFIMITTTCCWDRFKVSVLRFVLCSFGWLDGMFALITIILFKTTTCGGSEDCSFPSNTCFSQYDKGSYYDKLVVGGALIVTSSLVSVPYLLIYLTNVAVSSFQAARNDEHINVNNTADGRNMNAYVAPLPTDNTSSRPPATERPTPLNQPNDTTLHEEMLVVPLSPSNHKREEEGGGDGVVTFGGEDVSDFECGICYLTYTTDPVRRPCICRSCGNTLCHACVSRITTCAFCRAAMDPSKVVPNIAILQMLEKRCMDDKKSPKPTNKEQDDI